MRRLTGGTLFAVVLSFLLAACLPTAPSVLAQAKCAGALYCQSPLVPQQVSGGTCCVTATGSSVGYLCAFGANRQPAGCTTSVEEARRLCPNAASIVRCAAE